MASIWTSTATVKKYPKLERDLEVDALIIGSGITGITAAYLLAKKNKSVALIDKEDLSQSTTAYTTAFLTEVVDTGLTEMCEMFGKEKAKNIWQSHQDAIDIIEKNIASEEIDCEFVRCDNFIYANNEKEWEGLREDIDLAEEYGFDIEKKRDGALNIQNAGYAKLRNQAKFHPLKYLYALKEKAAARGAMIFDKTEAEEISENGPFKVRTPGGEITAEHVLIATYQPFNNPKEVFAHKGMYTSYLMELSIPSGALLEGIYEDEDNPYHYFRIDKDPKGLRDRVILGGEDHRQELPLEPQKAYGALEEYWKKTVNAEYEIVLKWSGPILETVDGLALIGPYSEKLPKAFLATGFSGNGMTYGTLSAAMFAEFVLGNKIPWKDLYDPLREMKPRQLWQKGKDFAEEFVHGYAKDVFRSSDGDKNKK